MPNIDVLTPGSLSALLIELLKFIWRKYVIKNPEYDFPTAFYGIVIPVLNVLVVPLLYFLGVSGYDLPTDWAGWGVMVIRILVASLISVFVYKGGIKPLKDYSRSMK